MAYKNLIFSAEDFPKYPEILRGLPVITNLPYRQMYGYTVGDEPRHYIIILTVEAKPSSLADIYGCREVVEMEIDFLHDSNTKLDEMEKEGILHNFLKTNNLLGKVKQWKRR